MTVAAHAKINLGLQIVRKREDGYHDIDTVFHRVAVADTLAFARRERGVALRCSDPALPTDEGNICVRAAKAVFAATGYDGGISIDLVKTIPSGAGLGGGSADAGAVLRALPAFLGLAMASADLHDLARGLGADVPYFLGDGTAHAAGRGDLLRVIPLDVPFHVVVAVPDVRVSTAWAYRAFRFDAPLPVLDLPALLREGMQRPLVLVNRVRNDFEPLVFRAHEEVMRAKEIFYRTGAVFALMTGSGSGVYAFFSEGDEAGECAAFLARRYPTFVTAPHWRSEEVKK